MRWGAAPGLLACVFVFGAAVDGRTQDGTWISDVDGLWSDTANWLGGIVASGAGNTATFSNEFASTVQVNLDSARTIGNLIFQQGTFTITNDGPLTLAGPSKPLIHVPGGGSATIRRTILAGTNGFILDGGGTLNLYKAGSETNTEYDPTNTWSGDVILNNGTLQIQGDDVSSSDFAAPANNAALGNLSSVAFLNGSTLNLLSDTSEGPNYGTAHMNWIVPEGHSGTLVLPPRFAGTLAQSGSGMNGTLTGGGTLNLQVRFVRGNIGGDWSAFTGQINVSPQANNAEWRFGNPTGFPNASVDLGGSLTLTALFYPAPAADNSTVIPIGLLTGGNPSASLNGSLTDGRIVTFRIGAKQTNAADVATYAGRLTGLLRVIWEGEGTWQVHGDNNHSGGTIISKGMLQIGDGFSESGAIGTGPITNNGALTFARSGTLVVGAPIAGPGPITNSGYGSTLILIGPNTYSGPTVATAGKLIIGSSSQATGPYILHATAEGFGVRMTSPNTTLNISSLQFGAPASFEFDLGTFSNPTVPVVNAVGNVALNGDITVHVAGDGLSVGTITLFQYNSRSGTGSFVLGSLPPHITGATLNDDTVNRRVTLTITSVFDDTLQWVGDAAAVWDVNNPANKVWRVVGSGQLTNYYDGAKVLFDDTATGSTTINVSSVVFPQSVTVNNSTLPYVFTGVGSISGSTALTKQGSNRLTIVNLNSYSGLTRIEAGTVQVGDGVQDGTIGSGAITNNGTLEFNRATLLTVGNIIGGSGSVVQSGPGQITLTGNNSYTGGLVLKPGTTLGYNHANAAGVGGGITVQQATVLLGADIAGNVGPITVLSEATFRNTGANRVINPSINGTNVVITFDKSPNIITLNGSLSGVSGIITNMGTGLLRFNSGGANNVTGSPNVHWVLATPGGFLQPRNASVNYLGAVSGGGTISAQQTAGGNNMVTWVVGDLNASTEFGGVISDGLSFGQPARYTALTKVGSGTWTLNNATLSYRASTVVSNGTLALVGTSLPEVSTNVVVVSPGVLDASARVDGTLSVGTGATNQTLRGDGTIKGNLLVGPNGRVEPGFSIGLLTVTGSAQLGGTNVMEINRANTPNSDRLVAQSIAFGGALIITNTGGPTFSIGDTFQLFSASAFSGSFALVVLPPLDCPSMAWDTSQLGVNGTISVTGTPCVSTEPPVIQFELVGGQLELSWPETHVGWRLQTQTNAVGTGIGSNWMEVVGSGMTNRVWMTVDPANGSVFFRLIYP